MKKELKKKIYKWVEELDKDFLYKEGITLLFALILYLIGAYLDLFQCIVIYLLVRIWMILLYYDLYGNKK